jgi:hypothetical protein
MRATMAGLAALCLLAACGEAEPTAEVTAASELCEMAYGTMLYPERWGTCGCFAETLMELPEGAERLAGAHWMVTELGYPILAVADGTLSGTNPEAFVQKAGLADAAELHDWYQAYLARVQPTAAVTPSLIQASGAKVAAACVK